MCSQTNRIADPIYLDSKCPVEFLVGNGWLENDPILQVHRYLLLQGDHKVSDHFIITLE